MEYDYGTGAYQDIDLAVSNWDAKSIYVLCAASYIAEAPAPEVISPTEPCSTSSVGSMPPLLFKL
eukprot:2449300-Ditylum_brightwellii.AAC.1